MFDFLIFTLFALLFFTFGIAYLRLKNKNLSLLMLLNKTIYDIEILGKKINNDMPIEKEHLFSFLNETRDSAYQYIEEVHKALLEYESEIEFDLENPNDLSISRFRSAFEKLKKIYPQDIPND